MNKTYFDKLSRITYNDFITDTSTYKNNIEELLNGCESVLRNVCNKLNENYSKWETSYSDADLIRLLQNYMGKSLGDHQIKNKDYLILMGFAMYSIRKLIGDLKNIFSSFEKEDDEHKKHLYFNLIQRVSASGTRLIREISDFADIALNKCIQLTNPRPS